jgi:uncharacterized protein YndB with AHSA1/START domain
MSTDVIRKEILLKAPAARVWRALSDAQEFGRWFGFRLDGQFQPGAKMTGVIVGTEVDDEVRKAQKQYEGKRVELQVERMEPEKVFSFRWHPNATDESKDYSAEPTTLVEFTMQQTPDGVNLTLTESGFETIPLERRAQAFSSNDHGWSVMVPIIGKYVAQQA